MLRLFFRTLTVNKPSRSISADNLAAIAASQIIKYIPEIKEIRINPVVSKRNYMNFLEENSHGWLKRWVVRNKYIIPILLDIH